MGSDELSENPDKILRETYDGLVIPRTFILKEARAVFGRLWKPDDFGFTFPPDNQPQT